MRQVVIEKAERGRKYIKGFFWQCSLNSMAQTISFAIFPLLTRLYSPSEFGEYSLYIEYMSICTVFISFRLEHLIVMPSSRSDALSLYRFIILGAPVVGLLFFSISLLLPVSSKIVNPSFLLLLFMTSYYSSVGLASINMHHKFKNFRITGISEVINKVVFSISSIILFLIPWTRQYGLLYSSLMGYFFRFKYLQIRGKTKMSASRIYNKGLLIMNKKQLWRLVASLVSSHTMLTLSSLLPIAFIGHRYGANETGYYALVYSSLSVPTALVGKSVNQVFTESAVARLRKGKTFTRLLIANLCMLVVLSLPILLLITMYGAEIYAFLFGERWRDSGIIAETIIFSCILSFLSTPFDRSNIIVNAWYYGPVWHFLRLVTTLISMILAIKSNLPFIEYVKITAMFASLMYMIDIAASLYFSTQVDSHR